MKAVSRIRSIALARMLQFVSSGILAYVLPVYLGEVKGLGDAGIANVYLLSYIGLFAGMFCASHASLRGYGKKVLIFAGLSVALANTVLFFSSSGWILLLAFAIGFVADYLFSYLMDVFLEFYTSNGNSGTIRGFYIFAASLSWVLATFASLKLLAGGYGYGFLFAISISISVILVLFVTVFFKNIKVKNSKDKEKLSFGHARDMVKKFRKNPDLRRIFSVKFALSFFYAFIVPFATIYMVSYANLSWGEVAWVYLIVLSPFVFASPIVGRLADNRFGEKEFMIFGLILVVLFTFLLGVLNLKTVGAFVAVLLGTRIGASVLDVASDSYFFKKVDDADRDFMAIFRMTVPLAGIVSSAMSYLVLSRYPMEVLFVAGSLALTLFLVPLIKLKDTR